MDRREEEAARRQAPVDGQQDATGARSTGLTEAQIKELYSDARDRDKARNAAVAAGEYQPNVTEDQLLREHADARDRDRARNAALAGGYYQAPAQTFPSPSRREVDVAELANFDGDNVEDLMNHAPKRFANDAAGGEVDRTKFT